MIGVGTGWVLRNGPMVWPRRKAMRDLSPLWGGWWKVTGIFDVLLSGEKTMKVVRVSACPSNGSLTIHLEAALFRKRFNINKKQAKRAKR